VSKGVIRQELVGMAEIGVIQDQGVLRTLLGSCIGVVLYERKFRLLGLAHVVMPDSKGRSHPLGKYADTAIPETVRCMKELLGVAELRLTARIAGGANMFARVQPAPSNPIGDQNRIAVEEVLRRMDIPLRSMHVGGTSGRRLVADAATGAVDIHVVGQSVIRMT